MPDKWWKILWDLGVLTALRFLVALTTGACVAAYRSNLPAEQVIRGEGPTLAITAFAVAVSMYILRALEDKTDIRSAEELAHKADISRRNAEMAATEAESARGIAERERTAANERADREHDRADREAMRARDNGQFPALLDETFRVAPGVTWDGRLLCDGAVLAAPRKRAVGAPMAPGSSGLT